LGYIVPTSFLTQVSYSKLRKKILANGWFKSIIRMPNELFGEATGDVKVDTCVIVIQKQKRSNKETNILIYDSFERVDKIDEITASSYFNLNQSRWRSNQDNVIGLARDEVFAIIDQMKERSVPLHNLCDFSLGITPYDKYAGHTKEQIRDHVFH